MISMCLCVSVDIPLLGSLVPFLQVVVGDHDLTDDQGDFYKVSSILKHPDYNDTLPVDYDIAILTLRNQITFFPDSGANLPPSFSSSGLRRRGGDSHRVGEHSCLRNFCIIPNHTARSGYEGDGK